MSDQLKEPLLNKSIISTSRLTSNIEMDTYNLKMNQNSYIIQLKFSSLKEEWKNKKAEALNHLFENKADETLKYHLSAYQGETSILYLIDNQNDYLQKFQKNSIGLTPFIYSIWGDEDRNFIKNISKEHYSIENESYNKQKFLEAIQALCKEFQNYELLIDQNFLEISWIANKKPELSSDEMNDYRRYFENSIIEYFLIMIRRYKCYEIFMSEIFYAHLHSDNVSFLILIILSDRYDIINEVIISGEFKFTGDEISSLLLIAIQNKAIRCSELILEHIVEKLRDSIENKTEFPAIWLKIIENEIGDYLNTHSIFLNDLLSLLIEEKSKIIQEDPNNLPKCEMTENKNEIETIFKDIDGENEFVNVKISNSKITLPGTIGSDKSVNFFKNLESSQNPQLFKCSMIKYYVKYKWNLLWPFIIFRDLLVLSNIPLLVVMNFVEKDQITGSSYFLWAFMGINLILAIFEIIQLVALGPYEYFGNIDRLHFWGFFFVFFSWFIAVVCLFEISALLPWVYSEPFLYFIYAIIFTSYLTETNQDRNIKNFFIILLMLLIPSLGCIYFWLQYEYLLYITDAIIVIVISLFIYALNDPSFPEVSLRFALSTFRITLSIILICFGFYHFQLILLLEILSIGLLFIHLMKFSEEKNYLELVADFCVITLVSLNFIFDYFYVFNSIILTLCLLNIYFEISNGFDIFEKELVLIFPYYCVLFLIGINPFHSKIQYFIVAVLSVAHIPFWNSIVNKVGKFKSYKKIYLKLFFNNFRIFLFDWNTIDVIRLTLCGIWTYSIFVNSPSPIIVYALSVVTFLRGLTSFRSFDGTRYYVRLIFNSIQDISSFLIIFFYSTLCFGIIIGITKKSVNYEDIWIYSYYINLGEFRNENETFDLLYITFVVATVLNVIIMLNLLISILGDSFDKFQLSSQEIDCMEMTSVILEFELMFFFRRDAVDNGMFLTFCEGDSNGRQEWEGKILIVRKQLDEINNKMTENDEKLSKLIVDNDEKINQRITEYFGTMNQKISVNGEAIKRIENFIESKFSS